jgi:hypothetical protein
MAGDIENSVAERTGCWSLVRHVSGKTWWCYIRLKATGYSTNWLSEEEIQYPLFMWWEGPVTLANGTYVGSWGEDDHPGTDGFAGTISVTVDEETNRVTSFSATKTEVWPECPPSGSFAKIEGPKAGVTIPFYAGSGYVASGADACEAAPKVQYHDGCPGFEVTLRHVDCPEDGQNELLIRLTEIE